MKEKLIKLIMALCIAISMTAFAEEVATEEIAAAEAVQTETEVQETNETIPADEEPILTGEEPETGLVNVALGKKVTGGKNIYGAQPKRLVDGNTTNYAAIGKDTHITVDLGRRFPISKVTFYTHSKGGNNIKITGSNFPDFSVAEKISVLAYVEGEAEGSKAYTFETEGNYRYIRFEAQEGEATRLCELEVYSNAQINAGPWELKNTSDKTVSSAAGNVLKKLELKAYNNMSDEKEITVVVMLYDETGALSRVLKPEIKKLQPGNNTLEIFVAEIYTGAVPAGYKFKALAIESLTTFNLLCNEFEA